MVTDHTLKKFFAFPLTLLFVLTIFCSCSTDQNQQQTSSNGEEQTQDSLEQNAPFRYQVDYDRVYSKMGMASGERDTAFYEISSDMIHQARVISNEMNNRIEYRLTLQLKEKYHANFREITKQNAGNFLAIKYNDEIISSSIPVIQTAISNGRMSISGFDDEKEAEAWKNRLLN